MHPACARQASPSAPIAAQPRLPAVCAVAGADCRLRCSSVTYARYAPSSRLVRRAPRLFAGALRARYNAGFHHGLMSGRPINGGRVGPLGSHRLNAPGNALVPGGPARRWPRARRHLRLTAAVGRRPRTARRPGARSRRRAAPRRPGRRRARAATGPPRPAGTARLPSTCRTPGSPAPPALRRPRPSGPAPAPPRPAPSRAQPPAWCARRTDAAAGRVASSRRTRRRDLSCASCG